MPGQLLLSLIHIYTYVETDFVKALKHGYLVEVQEPSTIIQPGVLVGLNSLLEQEGSITLPTGEIIRRHPDLSLIHIFSAVAGVMLLIVILCVVAMYLL